MKRIRHVYVSAMKGTLRLEAPPGRSLPLRTLC